MNIESLLLAGAKARILLNEVEEAKKHRTLRAGSSGSIDAKGIPFGECPRKAYLRYLGVQSKITATEQGMFQAGAVDEQILLDWLTLGVEGSNLKVLGNGEVTTSWMSPDNVLVTGTPDIILADDTGTLLHGVEAKKVSSMWTAYNVHYKLLPSSSHLCQAAHYSLKLDIPYTIVYSSRDVWHVGGMFSSAKKMFDRSRHDVEFNEEGEAFRITPFFRAYTLGWSPKGYLTYHTKGLPSPVETNITEKGVLSFYEVVMQVEKSLPPRPGKRHVNGKDNQYNPCDYCPLKVTCDTHTDPLAWRDEAISVLTTEIE